MKKYFFMPILACVLLGLCSCNKGKSMEDSVVNNATTEMSNEFFDGREHVSLKADFLDKVRADQKFLRSLGKDYANELADKMEGYVTLVETYGLELKTREALVEYYALIEIENKYEHFFTDEELMQIMELD